MVWSMYENIIQVENSLPLEHPYVLSHMHTSCMSCSNSLNITILWSLVVLWWWNEAGEVEAGETEQERVMFLVGKQSVQMQGTCKEK